MEDKISVCLFTYNYEKYIDECLQSILTQRTNVEFEIIITDDCSTDRTQEICNTYATKYPGRIKLVFNKKNIGDSTANWINAFRQCKGKYIALIDGDDYFTDRDKLQKQFDVMEADNNAVLCFHNVKEVYANSQLDTETNFDNRIYVSKDFMHGWFIRTSSMFFKKDAFPDVIPDWVYDYPFRFDSILPVMLNEKGHTIFIDETMSAWRKHTAGTSNIFKIDVVKNFTTIIQLYSQLNLYTQKKYDKEAKEHISALYTGILLERIKHKKIFSDFKLFMKAAIFSNKNYFIRRGISKISK
ncbi:glycosyltransferase [Pinibacter aurantiacus]|uniref:Glycosyltransferase n=1 Tax=Pinibacter aurantiacus TaxID=2851599 RepID=A0A9E2S5L6_9BACT|nr:glycosyltransferase [Pinibacter aurantiacus]MBV4356067.1 glycosyltransferase [Pinibacter aurantiacus]